MKHDIHPLTMPQKMFRKYMILWRLAYVYDLSLTRVVKMVDKKNNIAIIIEAQDDAYLVSMLNTVGGDTDSYTETRVDVSHPLYSRVHEIAAILNIASAADEEKEIWEVGTSHGQGIYSAFISAEEAKLLQP
jgi:hypothetical protein